MVDYRHGELERSDPSGQETNAHLSALSVLYISHKLTPCMQCSFLPSVPEGISKAQPK